MFSLYRYSLLRLIITNLVIFCFIFPIDSLAGASNSDTVEFVIIDNFLHIISTSEKSLVDQCSYIDIYNKYIASRNNLESQTIQCNEKIHLIPRDKLNDGYPASYRASQALYRYYNTIFEIFPQNEKPLFAIDVSNYIPRKIWERHREYKYYDSICYNTALIASGILSLEDFSSRLFPLELLLGLKSLIFNYDEEARIVSFNKGTLATSPDLIRNRKTFTFHEGNKDQMLLEIQQYINDHFTPGSIICTPRSAMNKKRTAESYLTGLKLSKWLPYNFSIETNIPEMNPEERIELMITPEMDMGHCLSLVTPNLIIESNAYSPVNLVNISKALQQIIIDSTQYNVLKEISLYYFEVDHNNIINWSNSEDYLFNEKTSLGKLVKVLRGVNAIFESKDDETKGSTHWRPGIYTLTREFPDRAIQLRDFLDTQFSPLTESKEFSAYEKAYVEKIRTGTNHMLKSFNQNEKAKLYYQITGKSSFSMPLFEIYVSLKFLQRDLNAYLF